MLHFRNIHDTDSGFIHSVQFIYTSKQQGKPALVKNYDLRIGGAYIYSNIKLIIDHRILLEILTIGEAHWQECWIIYVYKSSAEEGQQIPWTVIQHF